MAGRPRSKATKYQRTDEERLRLFCERVVEARNRRAIASRTIKAGLTIRFGEFNGPPVETDLGDQEV